MNHVEQEECIAATPPPEKAPAYEAPAVLTYRGQEIVAELGPAQACSFNHSVLVCP